jgi:hypothetical protein
LAEALAASTLDELDVSEVNTPALCKHSAEVAR